MSWPWKKRSYNREVVEKANTSTLINDIGETQTNKGKENNKNHKYSKSVQISIESYTHLTGLEDKLKSCEECAQTLEDEVTKLNRKLSEAHSELTNKENLVKQHAKVAEDAVAGWEKAEAEAATLKNHLESVSLLKHNAEDRASQLDDALKECSRQIRSLKEQHDKELHEVILKNTMLFDKMKLELDAKVAKWDEELLNSAAENAALSRSMHECSAMVVKLSEERSLAEAEAELLRRKIESCEREVNSLKYELNITRKEAEIHKEEKNMSLRSAEVASKQHLDAVKKIAKLEAECQRLRGLVRKRLPGPAALAQMRLEVENLGKDYGESRLRKSPRKPPISHLSRLPEIPHDNLQTCQKENELLIERVLAMDEGMRMLKEALLKCNRDMQNSNKLCAQMSSKIQSLEAQLPVSSELKSPLMSDAQVFIEGLSCHKAIDPSRFSMYEDGFQDSVSCAGSLATLSTSELSYINKERNVDSPHGSRYSSNMDLMFDFLDMEKLANLSNASGLRVISSDVPDDIGNVGSEVVKPENALEVTKNLHSGDQHGFECLVSSSADPLTSNLPLQVNPLIFVQLRSKIEMVLELMSNEKDLDKVMVLLRHVMQDILHILPQQLEDDVEAAHYSAKENDLQTLEDDANITGKGRSLSGDGNFHIMAELTTYQELQIAISHIYDFVRILGKEAKRMPGAAPDCDKWNENLSMFYANYSEAINSVASVIDFVCDLSRILHNASMLHMNILRLKHSEVEPSSSDCTEKIVLPENKAAMDSSEETYPNGCASCSDSSSNPDIPNSRNLVLTPTTGSGKCCLEEFQQRKMDQHSSVAESARCTENFEYSKSQFLETDQLLTDLKSQLMSAKKSNSLAEIQLKCMTESYKSLEIRAEELQTEVNLLQVKIENLDHELQEERRNHQDTLARCRDLQEQLQRIDGHARAPNRDETNQDELAAAAEKLAECQETIHLLDKQLKSLRPQTESLSSTSHDLVEASIAQEAAAVSDMNMQEIDPSDSETNNQFRSAKQAKRSSPRRQEKQSRGIIWFFSSKRLTLSACVAVLCICLCWWCMRWRILQRPRS